MAIDSPEELATVLGDAARALREDPEGSLAGFAAGFPKSIAGGSSKRQTLWRSLSRRFGRPYVRVGRV